MQSEGEGHGVSVVIKYGKEYSDPWATFRGSPGQIRRDLVEFFGLDSVSESSLSDLVIAATQAAQAIGHLSREFKVERVSSGGNSRSTSASTADDAWAQAASTPSTPAEPEPPAILSLIAAAKSVDELKRLWAEDQEAFKDAAVMDAWKAKGKALKGASQ